MTAVDEIISAVKNLSEQDKGEFLERLAEIDFDDAWDRQIEADVKAGRLDDLIRASRIRHRCRSNEAA